MKYLIALLALSILFMSAKGCDSPEQAKNQTAKLEQASVEKNQTRLNSSQPAPSITWSLERDNLIKRFKLMNDRSVLFYMYVYSFASSTPIGYYQVNKVSSVNSQLTNPGQIVMTDIYDTGEWHGRSAHVLDSPAEDGSYGTNGNGVFGFTPDNVYIEHNMQYILSTVPLNVKADQLAVVNVTTAKELGRVLDAIK